MVPGDDLQANTSDLRQMSQQLMEAAEILDTASEAPPSVDAGASSAVIGKAIQGMLRGSAAISAELDDIAGNIHAASGAYDETENTNESKLERLKRAAQYEKFVNKIPQKLRNAIAAYPGAGNDTKANSHRSVPKATAAGRVLRSIPYVGSTLVVVNEAADAASGEQTWGKALASSGAQIGGAAAAGAVGAGWGFALAGPPGALIGGVVGGYVGGTWGDNVVESGMAGEE